VPLPLHFLLTLARWLVSVVTRRLSPFCPWPPHVFSLVVLPPLLPVFPIHFRWLTSMLFPIFFSPSSFTALFPPSTFAIFRPSLAFVPSWTALICRSRLVYPSSFFFSPALVFIRAPFWHIRLPAHRFCRTLPPPSRP